MSAVDTDGARASQDGVVDRQDAETYASWFRSLADPTRILILNLLATRAAELSVGEISTAVGIAQPTASHHLKVLHQVGFVLRRRAGTSVFYALNINCLTRFPTAAQTILGQLPSPPVTEPRWMISTRSGVDTTAPDRRQGAG
ncbi:MAG: ArsR/SmtB family transcription factor [Pseudonocardiaceae bacterium]